MPTSMPAGRLALTGAQQGLWYAQRLSPDNPTFNVAQYLEIDGDVDQSRLLEAMRQTIREADSLRLRFGEDVDGPYQWIAEPSSAECTMVDLSPTPDPVAAARAWMEAELQATHQLDGDRLMCCALIKLTDHRHYFYQRVHHLLADGFSTVMILSRLLELYQAAVTGAEHRTSPFGSYEELLAEEQRYLHSDQMESDQRFWSELLSDPVEPISLAGRAPAAMPTGVNRATEHLDREVVSAAVTEGRDAGFSAPTIALAAVATLVHRQTGATRVNLGLPVTARRRGVTMTVPSMLSNIVPLQVWLRPEMTLREVLGEVQSATRRVLVHQRYRYEQLRQSAPDQRSGGQRLVGPTVNILPVLGDVELAGARAIVHNLSIGPVEDASFTVYGLDPAADVRIDLDGRADHYQQSDLRAHLARLQRVFGAYAGDLNTPIGSISVLDDVEQDRLIDLGTTGHDADLVETVVQTFERHAAHDPESVAVLAADSQLTAAELNAEANRLAHYLRRRGVGHTARVAVALPRTSLYATAVLATLKLGAVLVPLDPGYPPERLRETIADCAPAAVLTAGTVLLSEGDEGNDLVRDASTVVIRLDAPDIGRTLRLCPASDPVGPWLDDAAYIIYTSGSTGRPKGVAVSHRSMANLMASHRDTLIARTAERLGRPARMAHTAGFGFDASLDPIIWMLAGQQLQMIDDDVRRDPQALNHALRSAAVDVIETTPSFARALITEGLLSEPGGPSVVALGGEAVDPSLWQELAEAPAVRAYNLYGPTETTVDSLWATMAPGTEPHIGASVANSRHYVLDNGLQTAPVGAVGELYVAGPNVALGYVGRPDLTAERFIPDAIAGEGARMYRTGDLVRRTDGGRLEFVGRADDQVKVRGFRIELGEVESALRALPQVDDAAVIVRGAGEQARLLGYVAGPAELDGSELRNRLAERLPGHLVPTAVVALDQLPITANGKIDRAALPDPQRTARPAVRPPAGPQERLMVRLFTEVLGVDTVTVEDNFFELGGHSLLATRLIAAIRRERGDAPAIRDVFEYPTPAGLAALTAVGDDRPALIRRSQTDHIGLSAGQRRLWFLNRFDPASAEYNLPVLIELDGELDQEALRLALIDLVSRHTPLRTIIGSGDSDSDSDSDSGSLNATKDSDAGKSGGSEQSEPSQIVLDAGAEAIDLQVEEADELTARRHAAAEARAGFDLSRQLPMRVRLYRTAADRSVLLILLHHIAADGWSLAPLADDLSTAYRARLHNRTSPQVLPEPEINYLDYALWQRDLDRTDAALGEQSQLAFWRRTLAELPAELTLPLDRARPSHRDDRAGTVALAIPADVRRRLDQLARTTRGSLFMTLQAGLAALLSRLGAGDDIPIGTAVGGRQDAALERLVGFFVSTLVLRTDLTGQPTFTELLDRVRRDDLEAYAHQDVAFERLVSELAPARSETRHPLFQVMLTLQNTTPARLDLPGIDARPAPALEAGGAKFDLLFDLAEDDDGGLAGSLQFSCALFDHATVQQIADRYVRLLHGLVDEPGRPFTEVALIGAAERAELADHEHGPHRDLAPTTVVDRFAEQVRRTPEAGAVVDGVTTLTFAELGRTVGQLANRLRRNGVGAGVRVAGLLPRTADAVIGLLATLSAGGVYVPVDLGYPRARIEAMIDTARPAVLLTTADSESLVEPPAGAVCLHPRAGTSPDVDHEDRDQTELTWALSEPEQLAYVIFTSGSTGQPKGVAVEHRSLTNLFASHTERLFPQGGEQLRVAHVSGLAFDAAWDPVLWMIAGHQLHMIEDDLRFDPRLLIDYCRTRQIDVLETTPSLTRALLDNGLFDEDVRLDQEQGERRYPRQIALGGEAVDAELWRRIIDTGVLGHNLYGPSEFTVDSVMTSTAEDSDPVIGGPIANVTARVLDERLQPVPSGVVGELYLSGAGIARGYLGRPDLTAERFVADIDGSGERMYRTGDLVVRRLDGALRYLGRSDDQLKIRGFRIELGDIEAALRAAPGVRVAAVLATAGPDGDHRLIGYVVPQTPSENLDPLGEASDAVAGRDDAGRRPGTATVIEDPEYTEQLRRQLRQRLPDYMVPAALVVVDRIPLTSNGKVDRSALPEPTLTGAAVRRPRDHTEETLTAVLAEVLGVEEVGLDDDFFALGGHSLLAVRLVGAIRAALHREIEVRAVFRSPTVAGLAEEVASGRAPQRALTAMPRPDRLPLSYSQQRLWFLNRMDPESPAYNIVLSARLTGAVDVPALQTVLDRLTDRHEVLRTVFAETADGPEQHILPAGSRPVPFVIEDISAEELRDRVTAAAAAGFDLSADLPLRCRVLRLADDEVVLVLVLHHIAADGGSLPALCREISTLYSAVRSGGSAVHTRLPVQYADYALWQRELLGDPNDSQSRLARQLDFWSEYLADRPEESGPPPDSPRSTDLQHPAGLSSFGLDAEVHHRLLGLARDRGASLYMIIQAAMAALYQRLGAGNLLVFGSPVAGRTDPATESLIGFFVNTVAARVDVSGQPSFAELLDRTRESVLQILDHQDVPFERVVDRLQPERVVGRHPVFQTMITVQNAAEAELTLPGVQVDEEPEISTGAAKFDLSWSFTGRADGTLAGTLEYDSTMFSPATVERMMQQLRRLLAAVSVDPDRSIGAFSITDPAEQQRLSAGPVTAPSEDTLLMQLDEQQWDHPEEIAVGDDHGVLSYAALGQEADRIAGGLIRHGITRGDVVAVLVRRSARMMSAIFGTLKSGAIYLPIDPGYPAERVAAVLTESGAAQVITDRTTAALADAAGAVRRSDLDELVAEPGQDAATLPTVAADDPAYLIYTSGSTGRPKGVEVSHRSLANLADSHRRTIIGPASRDAGRRLLMAHTTGVGFDAAWDPVLWLVAGQQLQIVDDAVRRDPEALSALIDSARVDVLETTPSFARALTRYGSLERLSVLAVGGEPVDATLWQELAALPARVLNLYGPTEVTVDSVITDVEAAQPVAIGRPIDNTRGYLLDPALQPAAPGAIAELYLAGAGVARGYRGRPDLTAERFLPDPYGPPGATMYRTGDLARRLSDGRLEFHGRTDDQIKIRGFRVELDEVRHALLAADDVTQAAVLAVGEQDSRRLVAYITGDDTAGGLGVAANATHEVAVPDVGRVRSTVAARLPDYMVPAVIRVLPSLPLTSNGKLDNRALPAIDESDEVSGSSEPPRTPREQVLCDLFAEILEVPRVGIADNFFELGGHSLLAARLVQQAGEVLGLPVSVQAIFESPTPAGLLERILHRPDDPEASLGRVLPLRTTGERPPLFCIHPAAGLAWGFSTLLPLTDADQPVYGLQAPRITRADRAQPAPRTMTELADGYIAALQEIRPAGPYHLLGFSFGGNLAHAVAVRLQERGEQVGSLTILDAYPANQESNDFDDPHEMLLAQVAAAGYQISRDEADHLDLGAMRGIWQRNADPVGSLPIDVLEAMVDVFGSTARLLRGHRPGRFEGDVLLVRATTEVPRDTPDPGSWRPYVSGELQVVPVAEKHSWLIRADAMKIIAPPLVQWLADATEHPRHPAGADQAPDHTENEKGDH